MELRKRSLQSLILGAVALLVSPLMAEQIGVSQFKYLNNNDNSMTIGPSEAQDLLNVDIRPNGRSIKKREGYASYKDLSTGQAVRGGHHFFDGPGNDVQVWGSSRSLYGIVADGTPTRLISSATLNATWDCADTQGFAYCVNSSRDLYTRTNGATQTWYTSPLGTMVEITPERAVVSGVSGAASTLYFSESANFTNFTTGISETSPFTEVIASPGSKITHIRYGCGKLLWWKDQSFGYLNGSSQFDIENKIVSDNVGTFDNTSAIDPGGSVWFRGQDGHIWRYDCSALTKESIEITPLTQASGKRVANYWTQTSQSDFATGVSTHTNSLSATITPGAVTVSSFSAIETSSSDFNDGTLINSSVISGNVYISTNNANILNNGYESGAGFNADNWTAGARRTLPMVGANCTINARTGSYYGVGRWGGLTTIVKLRECVSGQVLKEKTLPTTSNSCSYSPLYLSQEGHARKKVKISVGDYLDSSVVYSDCFISNGSTITFHYASDNQPSSDWYAAIDDWTDGRSTVSSGVYVSKSYDTGFPQSYTMVSASWTVNGTTPTINLQKASSTSGPWTSVVLSSGTSAFSQERYIRYTSTITVGISDNQNALSSINEVTLLARSTGSFRSIVRNAPNLTSWDTFSAGQTLNDGTLTYYTRASTSAFTVLSATPAWVAQNNGSIVAASTGTYLQARIDFGITAATQTPTLNDFTFNWFEGTATDQSYGIYFDNAVWFTVAYGAGQSNNNYIFKRDLINDGWTVYDFGSGGFVVQNNKLYFGQPTSHNVFRYGGSPSDNGSAITAYWKSKDYPGSDPFLQNTVDQIDTLWAQNTGQTATVTYTLDTSSATAYDINLTSSTNTIINHRKLLPGKLGYTVNWKFGDSSATSAWELLGYRFTLSPQPYRPSR